MPIGSATSGTNVTNWTSSSTSGTSSTPPTSSSINDQLMQTASDTIQQATSAAAQSEAFRLSFYSSGYTNAAQNRFRAQWSNPPQKPRPGPGSGISAP